MFTNHHFITFIWFLQASSVGLSVSQHQPKALNARVRACFKTCVCVCVLGKLCAYFAVFYTNNLCIIDSYEILMHDIGIIQHVSQFSINKILILLQQYGITEGSLRPQGGLTKNFHYNQQIVSGLLYAWNSYQLFFHPWGSTKVYYNKVGF